MRFEKEVISIPASGTIDIIYEYEVHAHPVKDRGYNYKSAKYYTFRKERGIMEKLFSLETSIILNVTEELLDNYYEITSDQLERLRGYIKKRNEKYGFEYSQYKFYLLKEEYQLENKPALPKRNNHSYFTVEELMTKEEFILVHSSESSSKEVYYEGSVTTVELDRYERNLEARKKCIESQGYQCKICGFDFEEVYGEIGKGFIHVHHVIPISSDKESRVVDYEKDLIPVCPNCHAMIHRRKNPYTPQDIKMMLGK